MNFKRPKEEIINEVFYRADSRMRKVIYDQMFNQHHYNNAYGSQHNPYGYSGSSQSQQLPVIEPLVGAIAQAIAEAARVIMENTYTDEEFEQDLNLKEKK